MTLVMSISQEQTGVMTDRKPYFEICRLVRNHISEDFVRKNVKLLAIRCKVDQMHLTDNNET